MVGVPAPVLAVGFGARRVTQYQGGHRGGLRAPRTLRGTKRTTCCPAALAEQDREGDQVHPLFPTSTMRGERA